MLKPNQMNQFPAPLTMEQVAAKLRAQADQDAAEEAARKLQPDNSQKLRFQHLKNKFNFNKE